MDGLSKILYTRGSSDIGQVLHTSICLTIVLETGLNWCLSLSVSDVLAAQLDAYACANKQVGNKAYCNIMRYNHSSFCLYQSAESWCRSVSVSIALAAKLSADANKQLE